jgi:hypothetical protein
MAKIRNRQDLEQWLETQSREVAAVIAVRAALRVVPLLSRLLVDHGMGPRNGEIQLLPLIRALAVAWGAIRYSGHSLLFVVADVQAPAVGAAVQFDAASDLIGMSTSIVISDALNVVLNASDASVVVDPGEARLADDAVRRGAADVVGDVTRVRGIGGTTDFAAQISAVTADVSHLRSGLEPGELALRPLWENAYGSAINDLQAIWSGFALTLLTLGRDWDVWTSWYEDRLHGRPADEEKELARLTLPEEMWKDPAVANAEIKRRFAEIDAQRRREFPAETIEGPEVAPPMEPLAPDAAATRFQVTAGIIDVAPPSLPADFDRARTYHAEATRLTFDLAERLAMTDAVPALAGTVEGLLLVLTRDTGELQPDQLRLAGHGITAIARAYGHPAAEFEITPDSVAALFRLNSVLDDLQTFFPAFLAENRRQIAEQNLSLDEVAEVRAASDRIGEILASADAPVGSGVVETYKAGRILSENLPDERRRAEVEGERVLVTQNLANTLARGVADSALSKVPARGALDSAPVSPKAPKRPGSAAPPKSPQRRAPAVVPSWSETLAETEILIRKGFPKKIAPAALDALASTVRHAPKSITAIAMTVVGVAITYPLLFGLPGLGVPLSWIIYKVWRKSRKS